jgi:hypothetical protein
MRWLLVVLLLTGCSSRAKRAGTQAQAAASPQAAATPSNPSPLTSAAPPAASSPAPEGWAPYPRPAAESAELRCANHSQREWRVEAEGEGLKISPDALRLHQDPLPPEINLREVAVGTKGERRVLRVEDGWLVGIDVGEFGGGLWWFGPEGGGGRKLSAENVVGFARTSKGVLALTGLAHMGLDYGKVLSITDGAGEGRKVEPFADLGAAPQTFVEESPDSLLILTTRALLRVSASGEVEQLLPTTYSSLYPNSMTLSPSGVVHVGMRHFVTRLTPAAGGYKEEWFVPAGCAKFRLRGFDCVCASG